MALDRLVGMTVFRRAVELGSLAAAARALELSPEMAGQHLKALEGRLGVRLLKRTTRRLSLTDAGRAYYDRCVAALDEIALAEAEAGSRQAEPGGRLRIAAPLAFGTALLAPAIAAFLDRHPGVSVEVDLSERAVDLLAENVDLALRLGELPPSGLIARRLASFPLILAASPGYLSNHPAPERPRDLASHQTLIYTQTHAPTRWSFTGLAGTGPAGTRESVAVDGRIRASDVSFLLHLALIGRGILLAPSFVLEGSLAAGRLVPVLPDWHERSLPLHALWPHRTLIPATVRAFLDFLGGWFANGTAPTSEIAGEEISYHPCQKLPDRFRTEQARSGYQPEMRADMKDNGSGHALMDSL